VRDDLPFAWLQDCGREKKTNPHFSGDNAITAGSGLSTRPGLINNAGYGPFREILSVFHLEENP
jgi:hypothetical protein